MPISALITWLPGSTAWGSAGAPNTPFLLRQVHPPLWVQIGPKGGERWAWVVRTMAAGWVTPAASMEWGSEAGPTGRSSRWQHCHSPAVLVRDIALEGPCWLLPGSQPLWALLQRPVSLVGLRGGTPASWQLPSSPLILCTYLKAWDQ